MRLARFAIWLFVLALSACGGSAPPPLGPGEAPAAGTEDERSEPLASLCPPDTDLYVEISRFRSLLDELVAPYVTGDGAELLRPASLGRRLAEMGGFDPAHATAVIEHIDRVGIAVRGVGDDRSVALLVSIRDAAAMAPLLDSDALVAEGSSPNGSALYRLEGGGAGRLVAWNARRAVIVAGDTDLVADIARIDDGSPSLATTADFVAATRELDAKSWARAYFTPKGALAAEHLGRALTDGLFRPPQPWAASLALTRQGVAFQVQGGFAGGWVPPDSSLPVADTTELARRLPRETAFYVTFSTRTGLGGAQTAVQLQGLLDLLGVPDLAVAFRSLGVGDLGSLLGTLGDQGVGALVVPDGAVLRTDFHDAAFVFAVQIRDAATAESLVALAKRAMEQEGYVVTGHARELQGKAQPAAGRRGIRVAFFGDLLMIAGGSENAVARAHAALFRGEDTLAATAAHQAAMETLPAKAQLFAYSDTKRFFEALAQSGNAGVDLDVGELAKTALPAGASLLVTSDQDHLTVSFDSLNVIGPAAAMGIYGVRRYLASAKSAEAKNSVGAISRAAVAAYERELGPGPRPVHRLCGSSTSVPEAVPSATKYQPAEDYRSGDETTGWRCLRFEISSPQYYRYTYRQGGGYRGPARGGPDPCPHGFEVSAEGDLDGDGKTSLFTRTGTLDPSTGTIALSPQLFISDELE